ncbi:MAG: transporter, ATP-binding/permease protein [Lachnospiraceae bacterium]|jgi:ATP-binding cassette subfamily B protein|nr:transporter, ATP-binding/permease protein [Lachnospiraceae bacterium]
MLKLIKYLKKYTGLILIVFALLMIQALSDLSLPSYTSDIVDVGIQQGGIESTVPEAVRESQMNKLRFLLDDASENIIFESYRIISKDNLSQEEFESYLKEYPILSSENLYVLNTKEEAKLTQLKDIFTRVFLLVKVLNGESEQAEATKSQLLQQMPAALADQTLFEIVIQMQPEQADFIIESIEKQVTVMPKAIQEQGAVTVVKAEYEAIGIDIDRIQFEYIFIAGAKMIGLALVGLVATVLVGFLAAKIAAGLGRDLRSQVFHKVVNFSNKEFDKYSTATLITRSTNDIQQVQMMMVMMLRIVIYAPILAIGGVIKVLNTNTSMTWIIALGVVVIMGFVGTLFSIAMPKFKLMQKLVDRLNLVTREILTGLPVIRAFHKEQYEEKRFEEANYDLTNTGLFVNRVMAFMMPTMMFIMNGITVLIMWKGAKGIDLGNMQVGDLMAFIQYTMQVIMAFFMLTMISVMLPRATVSAARIGEIIDTDLTILDPDKTEEFIESKKGYVEFENVSFRYPNAEDDVISDITFTAKPGETTAIIGSTGSGKSTIVNLIPRFYDVTEGVIKVDGADIRKVTQHDLREKLGYIPQKGILFSGTIDSNIRYGKQMATEAEVKKAAMIAQAYDFIEEKPDRYNTAISQDGTNVSGGQKQRLSIARAIAKDPEIYIFDDSFSALDYKTDVALRKALKSEISNSTVIIVAQRISTILHAEQILVLEDGKIVGKGTHHELMNNCEVYQQIASSQLSKEELANE